MAFQSHFGEDRSHFFLKAREYERVKRSKPKDTKGKARIFIERSGSKKGTLSLKAASVRNRSLERKTIVDDQRLYFVVHFSDSLRIHPIRKALDNLRGSVTCYYDEKTVKIGVEKNNYNDFLRAVEGERQYIVDIVESAAARAIDGELASLMANEPAKQQSVTIEVIDLSGLRETARLESALRDFVQSRNGVLDLGYNSEQFAVFSAKASTETITEIADKIEIVERVAIMPDLSLGSSVGGPPSDVGLASVISISQSQQQTLPTICTIDSGVQKGHVLLQSYISDTYDFSTNASTPCVDQDGHGTLVSGVAVYGGSPRTHTQPRTNLIMVKGFSDRATPLGNIMQMIDKTVGYFSPKTRIFNLSFSSRRPNPSLTKVIDDLIFKKDILVIASAGNIPTDFIKSHINSAGGIMGATGSTGVSTGNASRYPNYLNSHAVFFPGDSPNAVTIGSFASHDSNFFRKNSPSPFTRTGVNRDCIKPDILEDGGNLNIVPDAAGNIIDFNCVSVGIQSTSSQNVSGYAEEAGTSFSSPAVASLAGSLAQRYPTASSALLKAILLSSCVPLTDASNERFSELIQGFGRCDFYAAINSTGWRVSYLLQGFFDGTDPLIAHRYSFLFPDNADMLSLTIVSAKPAGSKGFFTYTLRKSGIKSSSNPKPQEYLGSVRTSGAYRVFSTYKAIFPVKRGGKGLWSIDIIPHYDQTINADQQLRYGCVITVESSKNLDVYRAVSKWVNRTAKVAVPVKPTTTIHNA